MARISLASGSLLACIVLFIGGCAWQQESFSLTEARNRNNGADRSLRETPHLGRRVADGIHHGGSESQHGESDEHATSTKRDSAHREKQIMLHEEEDPDTWSRSNMIAIMLFLFMFIMVFFVYVVFYRDPDIRKAIYMMLNSTMSIFIAVTINTAAFSFFLEQVIAGKGWNRWGPGWSWYFPRGLASFPRGPWFVPNFSDIGTWGEFNVSVMIFFCCNLFLNFGVTHRLVGCNENRRSAIRTIAGHWMAFAGIITFGTMQCKAEKTQTFGEHHYLVAVLAVVVVSVLRFVSGCYRDRKLKPKAENCRSPEYEAMEGARLKEHTSKMKEAIFEGENDASSLIFGFLMMQLAVWKATGDLMPLHASEHHKDSHTGEEFGWMVFFFVISIGMIPLLSWCDILVTAHSSKSTDGSWLLFFTADETGPCATARNCTILTCLTTASWLALIIFTWTAELCLQGTPLRSHEMAEVFAAFVITILSVGLILAIDKIADNKKESVEIVLRRLIEAIGVLVGLGWEKACHGAMDTMIESTEILHSRPVISNLALALIVACFLLPAWYLHIMPMASKTSDEHRAAIDLAEFSLWQREGRFKDHEYWEEMFDNQKACECSFKWASGCMRKMFCRKGISDKRTKQIEDLAEQFHRILDHFDATKDVFDDFQKIPAIEKYMKSDPDLKAKMKSLAQTFERMRDAKKPDTDM